MYYYCFKCLKRSARKGVHEQWDIRLVLLIWISFKFVCEEAKYAYAEAVLWSTQCQHLLFIHYLRQPEASKIYCSSLSRLIFGRCHSHSVTANCSTKMSEYAKRSTSSMRRLLRHSHHTNIQIYTFSHTTSFWACIFSMTKQNTSKYCDTDRRFWEQMTWVVHRTMSNIMR